ncbi:L,D-transpeptidase [Microvirga sp. W0021]|uniref:L,D-transpeptidase n=1 Tax=Hohaiivirga grylli TaxID=3133970 RepID=A0ABV0BJW3_9HYPH
MSISRFAALALLALPLAACQPNVPQESMTDPQDATEADIARWYIGTIPDDPFDIPQVDTNLLPEEMVRQTVKYNGSEQAGTIVVDIDSRHLYLVQNNGTAVRYGIGVGKQGFSWKGAARVGRKGVWPNWSPTSTMVRIKPDLPRHVKGGLDNPLGARALYLYNGNVDTLFRIHGTNEPWSIGQAVSSGCIRMLNQDVLDLYQRVEVGAPVIVKRTGKRVVANAE